MLELLRCRSSGRIVLIEIKMTSLQKATSHSAAFWSWNRESQQSSTVQWDQPSTSSSTLIHSALSNISVCFYTHRVQCGNPLVKQVLLQTAVICVRVYTRDSYLRALLGQGWQATHLWRKPRYNCYVYRSAKRRFRVGVTQTCVSRASIQLRVLWIFDWRIGFESGSIGITNERNLSRWLATPS